MPLKPGSDRATIGSNIREMSQTHPHNQAVAAALRSAYGPGRDDGGAAPSSDSPATTAPESGSGALLGPTGGRDDAIHTSVPDGTHILPADVVSSLGDGNSVAGAAKLSRMFPGSGPKQSGIKAAAAPKAPAPMKLSMAKIAPMPRIPHIAAAHAPHAGSLGHLPRMPHMPGAPKGLKDGGKGGVKVRLSDGEFRVPPDWVKHIGEGDAERGHNALDAWIMSVRHQDIERRKRLPGPVKS